MKPAAKVPTTAKARVSPADRWRMRDTIQRLGECDPHDAFLERRYERAWELAQAAQERADRWLDRHLLLDAAAQIVSMLGAGPFTGTMQDLITRVGAPWLAGNPMPLAPDVARRVREAFDHLVKRGVVMKRRDPKTRRVSWELAP